MLYVDYHNLKEKYQSIQNEYDDILTEKEELFLKTQPRAASCENERVAGGHTSNAFERYVIEKEKRRIDERLNEIRSILEERKELLRLKECELTASKDWSDIIYVFYFLNGLTITQIESRIPYSRAQIWRKLKRIKYNIRAG